MMNNKDFNLREKDIYKLFNQIKIEESEFADMDKEISSFQKEKIKKNLNKRIKEKKKTRILKYSSTAAAVGLALLIGVGSISLAADKNIPVLSSIIQTLNDKIGDAGDYAEYSQVLGESVTDKGITFTINEVLADDSRLIISYTIKSDKKIKDPHVFTSGSLKINGKDFSSHGSAMGHSIDDYTYIGSEEISIATLKIPEIFNVNYKINRIMDIKGKWQFAFSVSKDEISKESTVFKPNKKIDFPDSVVTVDKVVFSPIGTYINVSGNYKSKAQIPEPSSGLFEYYYWLAYDDKGVELIPNGIGGGSSQGLYFNSEMNYTKVKDIPKYLTIIPCKVIPSGGGGISEDGTPLTIKTKKPKEISKNIDGMYPIELAQGKMGKLVIKELKKEADRTIVRFTGEGKAPYFQASKLYIKDADGEMLRFKNYDIKRDAKAPNEFTVEFEALDPSKEYSICTTTFDNVELREDLKFNIELKN